MSILNNSNSNIDKILKNDEKRGSYKKSNRQTGKGKSPTTSEKSMNINYNPGKSHQIFDMTESEDGGPSPTGNKKKYIVKNVRKMEKDDINNIVGLRKSTKLGNLSKSRTNQSCRGKSSMGA